MIHNFKTEIERIECDNNIRKCLKELYDAEERGISDPTEIPNESYYERIIEKYCEEYGLREGEVEWNFFSKNS